MDGTYGNYLPANRTMSPTVSTTSSGADRYKVNVSRQKTQKWANFKPQNYGDGWGDDDEDEWDEPEPAPPQKPMGPRQPATLPSSSSTSFLPSQAPLRLATDPKSSIGSLGSLPSQSQHSLASPGGSVASPTKPPFVRPAEIYRRLEEEKRKSLEATSPKMANSGADKTNAPIEPTRYTLSDSEPVTVAETQRAPGAGLATVPERRSEYGLEGLLDSYGAEEQKNGPSRDQAQPIQQASDSQVQAGVELRRFSSSPQLPLVTRMSGFGEDLFSPTTFMDDTTKQVQSPSSTTQNPVLATAVNAGAEPDKETRPLHVSGDLIKSNAGPTGIDASIRSQSPLIQPERPIGLQDSSTAAEPVLQQQQPTDEPRREPASSTNIDAKFPIRPSLPGGWVTETLATPVEDTLSAQPEPLQAPSLASTSDADRSRQPSPAIVSGANKTILTNQEAPPLPPTSPLTKDKLDMPRDPNLEDKNSSLDGTQNTAKTPPIPISQNRDITPIAPLNPRRDAPEVSTDVQPVLSPPSNGTELSLEVDAHSPMKESDVLSQEIIKSLSPVQSSENFGTINESATSAYQAAAEQRAEEPGRESSYLGDVYDDYWTAGEEKADHAARETGESPPPAYSTKTAATAPDATPTQTAHPENAPASASQDDTAAAPTSATPGPGDNRRRFSWEAGFSDPAPVVTQLTATPPAAEPKTVDSNLDSSPTLAATAAPEIPSLDGAAPSLVLRIETDGAPVSGQVSQSSTPAPRSANVPIEPPSPLSVASESQPTPKALVPRAQSPKNHVNIVPFRSILEMGSPVERTKQFDDARYQFAAIDTGLEEWLATMVAMHPEHNNSSFGASKEALPSPTGHSQQSGHLSSANIPMPPYQQHSTGFGHLHGSAQVNQVGTKSKELLMAAGKAGKGLFSKGRNKLRVTGDKVFS